MKPLKNDIIVQSNLITESIQNFSVIEKRLLYIILNQVCIYAETRTKATGDLDFESNLVISFPSSMILQANDNVTNTFKVLQSMRKQNIIIENKKERIVCGIINYARHNKKDNSILIEVSKVILPYLWLLTQNYTKYSFLTAVTFKSVYSQRFYEICKERKSQSSFYYDLDKLRKMFFGDKNRYPKLSHFLDRIIVPAMEELSESYRKGISDVYFTAMADEHSKIGKKYTRLYFNVIHRDNEGQIKDINDYLYLIRAELQSLFGKRKYVETVHHFVFENQHLAEQVLQTINKIKNNYPQKESPSVIRHALWVDYGIQ